MAGKRREIIWTLEACIEDAKKYKTRSEWRNSSVSAYNKAGIKNWTEICCKHMPKHNRKRLDSAKLLLSCLHSTSGYTTVEDWKENEPEAYKLAYKYGWVRRCKAKIVPTVICTLEVCIEIAKQFKTRTEWNKGHRASYQTAQRKKWMNECCSHMPPRPW